MSSSKVIFTYKRKRLSSHSSVEHADCTDYSLDVQANKQQEVSNKKVKSQEKDLKDVCRAEESPAACPSVALHNSGSVDEKHNVQGFDTPCSRNMILHSDEILGNHTFKSSSENVSGGAYLRDKTVLNEKDSCVQQSISLDIKGFVNGGPVSQLMEKHSIPPLRQSSLCESEVEKGKLTAPLRTFSRRVKKKLGASDTGLFTKLPLREGDTPMKECNFVLEPSCASERASKESSVVDKSVDLVLENSNADMRNMVCHSSEKMISREIENSSCPCRQSFAESPILRHTEVTSTSQKGMGVDILPSKQTVDRTSGSIISNFHNPDTSISISLQKGEVNCSLNDEAVATCCNISSKMDEQPVLKQLQASSGDSQLTSGDSSDLKQDSAKRTECSARSDSFDLARPPRGVFVIDCNVVPEPDVQEAASDIIQGSSGARESKIVMPKGHKLSKGLELFGDESGLREDSSDVHNSLPMETIHNTKCLQLFSDDGNCGQLTQSIDKAPLALGLSLPTEPKHEVQTSKDSSTAHQLRNPNFRISDLFPNPHVQPSPDQASLRHRLLLESINTRATSLQGNRNISLDKFEPSPSVWSEEELDSLWIGIRRYGKGHWRAMLLDPRLRFAPWRVAGELEVQWEREQYKLFSGQHMSPNTYPIAQNAYKLADTQLSLGDTYTQRDNVSFHSNAQKLVTMASYGCGPYNNAQALMNGGEASSSSFPGMSFDINNCLPHWLRDPMNVRKPLDLPLPHSSNLPPMGGPCFNAFLGSSGSSCKGINIINNKLTDAKPSAKKPVMADNLIVIDSDASSEETISDDNNVRG